MAFGMGSVPQAQMKNGKVGRVRCFESPVSSFRRLKEVSGNCFPLRPEFKAKDNEHDDTRALREIEFALTGYRSGGDISHIRLPALSH